MDATNTNLGLARARERFFYFTLAVAEAIERSKEPYRRYRLVLSSSEPGYLTGVHLAICSNSSYTEFYPHKSLTRASRLGLLPFFPVFPAATNDRSKWDRFGTASSPKRTRIVRNRLVWDRHGPLRTQNRSFRGRTGGESTVPPYVFLLKSTIRLLKSTIRQGP